MRMQFLRAAAMIVVASVASAQTGSITGTVIDRATRRPIALASVTIRETNLATQTAADGKYTILGVPPGAYAVEVRRAGYRFVWSSAVRVNSDRRQRQDFELVVDTDAPRTPPPTGGAPRTPLAGTTVGPPVSEPGRIGPPRVEMIPSIERGVVSVQPSAGTVPPPGSDRGAVPSFENMLFPPELVMQHQRSLDLTADQRRTITEAVKALQNQTVDLQWNLQAEQQALVAMLEKRPINEAAAVAQMAKLVELEDAVKRTHLATLIKIKNALTDKQIGILNSVRHQRWEYPPAPGGRDDGFSFDPNEWTLAPGWLAPEWTTPTAWAVPSEWPFPLAPVWRQR